MFKANVGDIIHLRSYREEERNQLCRIVDKRDITTQPVKLYTLQTQRMSRSNVLYTMEDLYTGAMLSCYHQFTEAAVASWWCRFSFWLKSFFTHPGKLSSASSE